MIIKSRTRFVNIFVIPTLTTKIQQKKKCNEKRGRVENTSTFSVQNKQRVGGEGCPVDWIPAKSINFTFGQQYLPPLARSPLPIWLGLGQQFNIVFKHYLA